MSIHTELTALMETLAARRTGVEQHAVAAYEWCGGALKDILGRHPEQLDAKLATCKHIVANKGKCEGNCVSCPIYNGHGCSVSAVEMKIARAKDFIQAHDTDQSLVEPNLSPEKGRLAMAVASFAKKMKDKLFLKADEGFHGWDDPDFEEVVQTKLQKACMRLLDGDLAQAVDVANFAMMLRVMNATKVFCEDVVAWEPCGFAEAEEHRYRVLAGSIGLEGSWCDWLDGKPGKPRLNCEWQYRRHKDNIVEAVVPLGPVCNCTDDERAGPCPLCSELPPLHEQDAGVLQGTQDSKVSERNRMPPTEYEYKVFELKWLGNGPVIIDEEKLEVPASVGVLYLGHLLFGYTDDPGWQPGARQAMWYQTPCDLLSKRLYVIGWRKV